MTDLPRHRTRRTTVRAGAALLVVLALVASGCAKKNPDTRPGDIDSYVALGDSYTAVAGDSPVTHAACLRSNDDYPNLLAERLSIADFKNVACAGATSAALETTQYPANKRGSNPPQLDAVNEDTKLVTLGIGLNDTGLSFYLLYTCLPYQGKITAACTKYLSKPDGFIDGAVRTIGSEVAGDLTKIRKKAPDARIVLIGYPRMMPDTGGCPEQMPLPDEALDRIRKALKDVNDAMERAARRTRVDYVDMYTASKGHDVCSDSPWVNGQANIPGKALAFHPYDEYHAAVADKLAFLLEKK
ncbi:SGNH/GDSL hydrolase family protein [Nocardioides marmoriginsengisoli]|nr:SGNH/GDSL hydrolase family protein [Nocardioides marmoriginsengisoli]